MTQHTPEPWSFEEFSGRHLIHAVGESVSIARVFECRADDGAAEANARRIVACVNVCRGLPLNELEQKGLVAAVGTELMDLDERLEQAHKNSSAWEARATKEASRAADLQAQVDELLELLECIENDAGQIPQCIWAKIQHVVKKHTGVSK